METITIEFSEDNEPTLADLVETIRYATEANAKALDFLVDVADFVMNSEEEEDELLEEDEDEFEEEYDEEYEEVEDDEE